MAILEQRMDRQESRMDRLDTHMDGVDGRLRDVETTLSAVSVKVDLLASQIVAKPSSCMGLSQSSLPRSNVIVVHQDGSFAPSICTPSIDKLKFRRSKAWPARLATDN